MSMSLDGFIAGPNEGPDNGLGDGGHRLHEWLMTDGEVEVEAIRRSSTVDGAIVDEFMDTGAVVAGRGTFEPAGGWAATITTACLSSSSVGTSRRRGSRACRWSPT
jgi:dihydrofolate reductase